MKRHNETNIKKKPIFRLYALLCLPAAGALYVLAHFVPGFAEGYARTVYPVLSRIGNFLSGLFPFSLFEILLFLLIPTALGYIGIGIFRLVRGKEHRKALLGRFLLTPAAIVSVLLLIFMLNAGINYGREPFTSVSGLKTRPTTAGELEELCTYLCEEANTYRTFCTQNEQGEMQLRENIRTTAKTAAAQFAKLAAVYPTLPAGYSAPKPVLCSRGMSYINITGIFMPFTMEANVNVDTVGYTVPFVMCHELSHLRGYMREDEANFLAYLACNAGDDPDFRYAGALNAFVYAINALYNVDTEAVSRVYTHMDDAVLADILANNAYWKQFETPVAEFSDAVNDAYLQSNQQSDGVHSYGRMVDLLLAYYFSMKQ